MHSCRSKLKLELEFRDGIEYTHNHIYKHYNDVTLKVLRLISLAASLYIQHFCSGEERRNTKGVRHWPLVRESTGHRFPAQRASNAESMTMFSHHSTLLLLFSHKCQIHSPVDILHFEITSRGLSSTNITLFFRSSFSQIQLYPVLPGHATRPELHDDVSCHVQPSTHRWRYTQCLWWRPQHSLWLQKGRHHAQWTCKSYTVIMLVLRSLG